MGYPDDLLQYAKQMAEFYPNEAHQPSLRRALSSAYYALFHLLIADAVAHCSDRDSALHSGACSTTAR